MTANRQGFTNNKVNVYSIDSTDNMKQINTIDSIKFNISDDIPELDDKSDSIVNNIDDTILSNETVFEPPEILVQPQLNISKNVITKDDVERVLDLQFVSSRRQINAFNAISNDRVSGINDMKLSYHNFGAFQAYERARAQRISEMARRKLDAEKMVGDYTNDSMDDDEQHMAGIRYSILNSKCEPESKSCHIKRKTHRLAEGLISNIEEIKFLVGGPCDLCGRDSCDGFNHFPQADPVEEVTQVAASDIDTPEKSQILEYMEPIEIIQEPTSDATITQDKSNDEFESAVPQYEGERSVGKISIDLSDKEDVHIISTHNSDESLEFPSVFTIDFKSIELKPDGLECLEYSTRATTGFNFKYVFLMYKESIEFPAVLQGNNMNINEMRVHQFSINPIVYQYLYNCCLHIELYDIPMNIKRCAKLIGCCDVSFKKTLRGVDRSHSMKLLITDRERIAFVTNGKQSDFGILKLTVTLEADEEHVRALARAVRVKHSRIDVMGTGSYSEFLESMDSPKSLSQTQFHPLSDARFLLIQTQYDAAPHSSVESLVLTAFEKGLISEAEQKAFYDALQLVLVRNKALRTRQSEIDMELNDRAEWMHEELKWRLTLQEHAILSGKDPESVRWRQWRDENTTGVRFRTIMDEDIEYDPVMVITVEHLELLPLSQAMLDESVKLIYVEYAFLTHSGLELETKSLPKSAEGLIVYNFVKRFDISINPDNLDTQVLAEHIRTNHCIKFTVVHEPMEDPEELQTCVALGSCEINLFNLAQVVSNMQQDVYQLKNAKTGAHDLGQLKLTFDGVRAMRTVALTLLAPTAFKIYR